MDETEFTAGAGRQAEEKGEPSEISSLGEDALKTVTEVLSTLLKLMGIEAEVKALSPELPISLDIEGDDLGILIGRRGQTLVSLEYITRLIVAEQLKSWLPLHVDVAGYRKRRYEALQKLALYLAEQAKSKQRDITLEPMPPDERRIIHLTLTDHPDVATHSIGDGENRKVIISLRGSSLDSE
ncbi:MAG: RNA-binding cell elongation regulator Jag/EloR [Chloroflexota bacterium]|nr:RNA-binding cell elongation regulator Jag/EloR [Chloroflexota bacterium]